VGLPDGSALVSSAVFVHQVFSGADAAGHLEVSGVFFLLHGDGVLGGARASFGLANFNLRGAWELSNDQTLSDLDLLRVGSDFPWGSS